MYGKTFCLCPKDHVVVDTGCGSPFVLTTGAAEMLRPWNMEKVAVTMMRGVAGDRLVPLYPHAVSYVLRRGTAWSGEYEVGSELIPVFDVNGGSSLLGLPTIAEFGFRVTAGEGEFKELLDLNPADLL